MNTQWWSFSRQTPEPLPISISARWSEFGSHTFNCQTFKLRVSNLRTIAYFKSKCPLKVHISQGLGPFFRTEPLNTGQAIIYLFYLSVIYYLFIYFKFNHFNDFRALFLYIYFLYLFLLCTYFFFVHIIFLYSILFLCTYFFSEAPARARARAAEARVAALCGGSRR